MAGINRIHGFRVNMQGMGYLKQRFARTFATLQREADNAAWKLFLVATSRLKRQLAFADASRANQRQVVNFRSQPLRCAARRLLKPGGEFFYLSFTPYKGAGGAQMP